MMQFPGWTEVVPLIAFSPILLAMAWTDLTRMIIPNVLVIAGLVLFVCTLPVLGMSEAISRLSVGVACFAVCLVLFALRIFGGGDAKILPVVFLFVPSDLLAIYFLCLGTSLAIGLSSILLVRRLITNEADAWQGLRQSAEFPMGLSIGLSGFLLLSLWMLQAPSLGPT